MKINLIYLTNLNYRKSLFREIGKISKFTLIAGKKSPYDNIVSYTNCVGFNFSRLKNLFFFSGRHKLTFQIPTIKTLKLILNSRNSHFVFLGVDPHIISSIFYSLILISFGYKVSFWGHGTVGSGIVKFVRIFLFKKSHRIIVYGNNAEILSYPEFKHKVKVIGNTMNWEDYKKNSFSQNKKEKIEIIKLFFSGRINDSKKLIILLEACKKLKINYELVVIGEGNDEVFCRTYSEQNNINVKFLGAIYGDKVKEVMDWADVCIIPGKVGLSLAHAYGNDLPVIIHDDFSMHSPEYEIHTMNRSFLFEMDNSSDLMNKIQSLKFSKNLINDEVNDLKNSIIKHGYYPNEVAKKFVNALK